MSARTGPRRFTIGMLPVAGIESTATFRVYQWPFGRLERPERRTDTAEEGGTPMAVASDQNLQQELSYAKKLQEVTNLIHSADSVQEILTTQTDKIRDLLGCQALTLYAVDVKNKQLYSIFKAADTKQVIRVAKDASSIAGYCAATRRAVNVADAYDASELGKIHQKLRFDRSWDQSFGFRTRQVMAVPLVKEKYLLGVMQCINKEGDARFSDQDLAAAGEIAQTLAIAFYNQNRAGRATTGKQHPFSALVDGGLVSEEELEAAVTYARVNKEELAEVLMDQHDVSRADVGRSLSDFYGVPFFSFDGMTTIPAALLERVPEEFWRNNKCAPIEKRGGMLFVASVNPYDLSKLDAIKSTGLAARIEVQVGLEKDILEYLEASFGKVVLGSGDDDEEGDNAVSTLALLEEDHDDEPEEGEEVVVDSFIVRLANKVIQDGVRMGVSDIHVEPSGDELPLKIRFRRDGICFVYQELGGQHRAALVSRLKIMANLDISEKRKPQDGKIRFQLGDKLKTELRVATIPTAGRNNEDVVMRILASSKPIPLDKLGMSKRNISSFKEAVKKPYGLILCVGPTGSGKTTTLHSALGFINTNERKIWTAEDPVEITQPGLRQVQVKPKIGFDFAAAMRAFLRADPDVIMLGEMRDEETAGTGIEASLTGHLVFSTLHTNSAPETITRLLDLGLDPFNFADALLLILAQRLCRTLCTCCKESYEATSEEIRDMTSSYGGPDMLAKKGVELTPGMELFRAKGCEECTLTGYRGRMAVHEILVGTDDIQRLIVERKPVDEIRRLAVEQGMTTLLQDGIWKVTEGMTDMKQIRAVCIR